LKKSIIVFSPHPDDETLACGGTIAKKVKNEDVVSIVYMTDGRNALLDKFGISSHPSPQKLKEIRKKEAICAAKIMGISEENLIFFGYLDGKLKSIMNKVEKKTINILNDISPNEIYIPQPLEYNSDHSITNKIVKHTIQKIAFTPRIYQYPIAWSLPFSLLNRINTNLTLKLISSFNKWRIVSVDISKYLSIKKAAIMQYKSQFGIITKQQTKPVMDHLPMEHFLQKNEKFFTN
jgi:LmbE family N-acetylglucosaminyl deacetylase